MKERPITFSGMVHATNDGGPAFPRPPFTPGQPLHDSAADAGFAATGHTGMSLRDWFAGQALCGLMATPNGPNLIEKAASAAYVAADAMLRARTIHKQ